MSQTSKKDQPATNPSGEQLRMLPGSVPGVGSMGVPTTSTGPSLDLVDLRKVAEAATPGPWEAYDRGIGYEVHDASGYELNSGMRETFTESDATHIATFDPPTVLALLSRLEQAEQAVQRVRELHLITFYDKWGRTSLEPVGHGGWCSECGRFDGDSCATIRALDGDQA